MNWLSQEEIKRRAEESPEEALNVSIEHWEQICEAAEEGGRIGEHYEANECGLCQRCKPCHECPLNDTSPNTCCSEWRAFRTTKSLPNAQAMLNRLYMERGKRYPAGEAQEYKAETKECKKEKPEILHGDELVNPKDGRMFYALYTKSPHRAGSYENPLVAVNHKGVSCGNIKHYREDDLERTGNNIFDDLKRNAEDLREFEIKTHHGGTLKVRIEKSFEHDIEFLLPITSCATANIEEAQEIHQKLGQLIATAKRKQDSSYKK